MSSPLALLLLDEPGLVGVPPADVPATRRTRAPAVPAYGPCPICGAEVLTGLLPSGQKVALDTSVATWVVSWDAGAALPTLCMSRGYPVHRCLGKLADGNSLVTDAPMSFTVG